MTELTAELATTETATTEPAIDYAMLACEAWNRKTPDDEKNVHLRSAYRDLSCSMSGTECYRRVQYAGKSCSEWPDGDRLPARGCSAHDRRATCYTDIPEGTLVIDFDRSVYKGSKGKCSVKYGLAGFDCNGKPSIHWLDHRTLRVRPVHEVTLPDGQKIEIPRT
jgi:hypothetical protein